MVKRSQILWLQNMGPFQYLTWHGETVSNFAAAKYGTVSNFVVTWDLIFDMAKRSQILWLQNMGPFQILNWHVKKVSNFAAAKYGTVSIFVLTWWNSLKFCSCKIWDCFNFCCRTVLIFLSWHGVKFCRLSKYGTISIFVLTWWNSPKFCSRKIWDRFNFCL